MKTRRNSLLHNKKGSALIWALVIILVLSLLIAAGLSIGVSLNERELTRHSAEQAYYTARSTAQSIADWLANAQVIATVADGVTTLAAGNDHASSQFVIDSLKSGSFTLDNIPLPETMGTCAVAISGGVDTPLVIKATAEYHEQSAFVQAELINGETIIQNGSEGSWTGGTGEVPRVGEILLTGEQLGKGTAYVPTTVTAVAGTDYQQYTLRGNTKQNYYIIDNGAQDATTKQLRFQFQKRDAQATAENQYVAFTGFSGSALTPANMQVYDVGETNGYQTAFFYTASTFAKELTFGPMAGFPTKNATGEYSYRNLTIVTEYGAGLNINNRASLTNSEIYTRINTNIDGKLTGASKLSVMGGTTTLNGTINGAVYVQNGTLSVGKNATINGNIYVGTGGLVELSGSTINGNIFVYSGGELNVSGNTTMQGNLYLFSGTPPSALTGGNFNLYGTAYYHQDASINTNTIKQGSVERSDNDQSLIGSIPEDENPGWGDPSYVPGTPDEYTYSWGNTKIYTGD